MQPRPVSPPPGRLTLPIEVTQRSSPTTPQTEEAVASRRVPEEVWETVSPPGRGRLRESWVHVLKEVVGDAQDR
jgi:hypothetical protein